MLAVTATALSFYSTTEWAAIRGGAAAATTGAAILFLDDRKLAGK